MPCIHGQNHPKCVRKSDRRAGVPETSRAGQIYCIDAEMCSPMSPAVRCAEVCGQHRVRKNPELDIRRIPETPRGASSARARPGRIVKCDGLEHTGCSGVMFNRLVHIMAVAPRATCCQRRVRKNFELEIRRHGDRTRGAVKAAGFQIYSASYRKDWRHTFNRNLRLHHHLPLRLHLRLLGLPRPRRNPHVVRLEPSIRCYCCVPRRRATAM